MGPSHRLLELDLTVHRIHVQERFRGMLKTGKRYALSLVHWLYTQLKLSIQVENNVQFMRRALLHT